MTYLQKISTLFHKNNKDSKVLLCSSLCHSFMGDQRPLDKRLIVVHYSEQNQ
jgi:hypothetical protein